VLVLGKRDIKNGAHVVVASAVRHRSKKVRALYQTDNDIGIIEPKAHGLGYFYRRKTSPKNGNPKLRSGYSKLGTGSFAGIHASQDQPAHAGENLRQTAGTCDQVRRNIL
jgi:hypothetical protein